MVVNAARPRGPGRADEHEVGRGAKFCEIATRALPATARWTFAGHHSALGVLRAREQRLMDGPPETRRKHRQIPFESGI